MSVAKKREPDEGGTVQVTMSVAQRTREVERADLEKVVREVLGAGWNIPIPDLARGLKAHVEQAELLARVPPVQPSSPLGDRERLPAERRSVTRKLTLPRSPSAAPGDEPAKVYLTAGFNEREEVREIFLRADKVGSFVSGILDGLAITISLALQHGTPLRVICLALQHQRFEPEGHTGDPEFKTVSSVLDYIARYLKRYAAHAPDCEIGAPDGKCTCGLKT